MSAQIHRIVIYPRTYSVTVELSPIIGTAPKDFVVKFPEELRESLLSWASHITVEDKNHAS